MPAQVLTNIDVGSVALAYEQFHDELLTVAGAGTTLAGTLLARDSSTLKMVPFVKGGVTNGNGVVKAVLGYDVVAVGAGDVPIRAIDKGEVNQRRLIISADGTGVNIDNVVLDALRAYGITPVAVQQLSA